MVEGETTEPEIKLKKEYELTVENKKYKLKIYRIKYK